MEGVIYCDVDIEAIQPFDDLLTRAEADGFLHEKTEILLTTDHPVHLKRLYGGQRILMNHFMVAKPGARILAIFLAEINRRIEAGLLQAHDPVNATGPCALSKTIEQHGGVEHLGIGIMPSEWINPLPDMAWNFSENEPYDVMIRQGTWREALNPFVAHYWWHSYLNGHSTFERYGNSIFPPRDPAGSVPLAFL